MIFKDKKLLALLLFVVVIAFSIFSEYRKMKTLEGMPDDDDVPSCDAGDVPGCYSVLVDDSTVYGTVDGYINNAVPSYCPSCPTVMHGHSHGNRAGNSAQIEGSDTSNTSNTSDTIGNTILSNVEVTNTEVNESKTKSTVNENTVNKNTVNEYILNQNIPSSSNNTSNAENDETARKYEDIISSLRGEINKLKQSSTSGSSANSNSDMSKSLASILGGKGGDTCPPCPSCERCPEPSFTCEKRINYRSPNVGNYLPLPVLNDFSTFDNKQ